MNLSSKIILPILLAVIVGAGAYWYLNARMTIPAQPISKACTMEAKLCPDGSYVGRMGPDCAFAACPTSGVVAAKSGIKGTVLLGPTCPVMRIPPDPACTDKPYQTALAVMSADGSRIIARFSSGADGAFSVDVPPGDYVIQSAPGGTIFPRCGSSGTIAVKSNAYADAAVSCDTGIR